MRDGGGKTSLISSQGRKNQFNAETLYFIRVLRYGKPLYRGKSCTTPNRTPNQSENGGGAGGYAALFPRLHTGQRAGAMLQEKPEQETREKAGGGAAPQQKNLARKKLFSLVYL